MIDKELNSSLPTMFNHYIKVNDGGHIRPLPFTYFVHFKIQPNIANIQLILACYTFQFIPSVDTLIYI